MQTVKKSTLICSFLSSLGKIFGSFDLHTNDISDVTYNMNLVAENFSGKLAFEGLDVEKFQCTIKDQWQRVLQRRCGFKN